MMPKFPFTQSALLILAGLMWVTLPSEPLPSLEWRVHFGIAMWAFGAMSGIGLALWLQNRGSDRK
jgi:hypothetical protein